MSNYQKVIRGRDSLGKLREMADKTGIRKPMIIGTEPLIGTLMKTGERQFHPGLLAL